jgi:hypothetical protein
VFRIRIQHFRANTGTDPDPIRIQGFDDQKLGKKLKLKKKSDFFIFGSKLQYTYLTLGLLKEIQATGEAFSPQKRTSSTSKHEIYYIFSLYIFGSVADLGCLSRFPDPGFYPSRIPDLGSRIPYPGSKISNIREGCKKLVVIFFCSHKFHKIVNYFIFEMLKKKIWANYQRLIELFTQKIVTKL